MYTILGIALIGGMIYFVPKIVSKVNDATGKTQYDKIQNFENEVKEKQLDNIIKSKEEIKSLEKKLTHNITTRKLIFTKNNSNIEREIMVSEKTTFDENRDIIMKGTLKLLDENGNPEITEDIYLYQPQATTTNGIPITPTKIGYKLYGRKPYSTVINNQMYVGYIPKREITSNLEFDFEPNSNQSFNKRIIDLGDAYEYGISSWEGIEKYLQIEFLKDKSGNYKIVDLTNPEELNKFREYLTKYRSGGAIQYYQNIIDLAKIKLLYSLNSDSLYAFYEKEKNKKSEDKENKNNGYIPSSPYAPIYGLPNPPGGPRPPYGPYGPYGPMGPYGPYGHRGHRGPGGPGGHRR